jgi:hypothetical protein
MVVKIQMTDLQSQLETAGVNTNTRERSESPYLPLGTHAAKIIEATPKGASKLDSTWQVIDVVFEGVNGKKARGRFNIPTSKVTFGRSDKPFEFYRFRNFMRALGADTNNLVAEAPRIADMMLNNSAALIGHQVQIVVGYDAVHLTKQNGVVKIMDAKSEVSEAFKDRDFADFDSARAFLSSKGIYEQRFAGVTRVNQLDGVKAETVVNTLKSNSKKPKKTETEDEL